jgi:hypothetical protein
MPKGHRHQHNISKKIVTNLIKNSSDPIVDDNDNVLIGTKALASNTTGSYNIAIGKNTLTSTTTVNNNIAIGTGALYYFNEDDAALGSGCLTSGGNNIAIGQGTLYYNKKGCSNIAIGWGAQGDDWATDPTNTICIGQNATSIVPIPGTEYGGVADNFVQLGDNDFTMNMRVADGMGTINGIDLHDLQARIIALENQN